MELFVPADGEKCHVIVNQIYDGTGRMHAPSRGAGVYNTGFFNLFIPAGVGVAEENVVIDVGVNNGLEVCFVVAVQYCNFPVCQC